LQYVAANLFKIAAGQHGISATRGAVGYEQIRNVKLIHLNEDYNYYGKTNDIALVLLETPLQFTPRVGKISLPQPNEEFSGFASVTGCGAKSSNDARKFEMPIISNRQCQRMFGYKWDVTNGVICGVNDCSCDIMGIGGSLVCKRTDGTLVICGVVSYSPKCGRYPVISTKVSSYLGWIQKSMKDIQSMIE